MQKPDAAARAVSRSNPTLKRSLLASTCLTLACGSAASAGTITEGTSPAPGNFPTTINFSNLTELGPFVLPVGTNEVIGTSGIVSENGDTADWFEFQGLTPGFNFTLTALQNPRAENGLRIQLFDTTSASIGSANHINTGFSPNLPSLEGGSGVTFTGTVPTDGKIITDVLEFFNGNPNIVNGFKDHGGYDVTLSTAAATPEPATLADGGLALAAAAAALAWRRKRKA